MGWTTKLFVLSLLGLATCQQRSISGGRRRQRVPAGKSEVADFNCPEDFGYYPHPTDCSQYYVCVFGGALQESCTGGLVYSHELQTCDWPRNVVCNLTQAGSGVSTVRITDPRTRSNPVRPVTEPLTSSVSSFDDRLDNSLRSSQSLRASNAFDNSDKANRQARFFREQQEPKQQVVSSQRFQNLFTDAAVQESNRRLVNTAPVFPPRQPTPAPRPAPQPTVTPSVDDAFYGDLNFTDADYFYYYDLYDVDYYDNAPTATPAPVRRPVTAAPTRSRRPSTSSTSSSSNRGPPASSSSSSSSSSSGPVTVDNSVPKRPAPVRPQPPVDTKATKCDPKVCVLPDCYCGGKDIPGGFAPETVPQIVLLTFDDAVNDLNKGLYRDLFEVGRTNPNGCPIASTMYVSHEWTDYSQVQNLYADGHEIASHSVSHSFGEQFSIKKWAKEIAGQREIMAAYGGVKMEDVRGMRAPFLAIGGNKMFKMLYDYNFTYDSSMPVYENKPPSWPYTLDYKIFHDCMIPPCPTNSYPGVWQVPMVMWQDLTGGRCSMGDACTTPPDAEGVYKMLIKNFERHYTSNRAPFGLFYHAAWFTTPHHKEGFIAFLDTITAMDDVWLVTNWQLLQWMRDPQPLSTVKNFPAFGCNYPDRKRCTSTKVCNVWHKGGVRYMRTCQQCPEKYPWTGNTGVNSPLNDL
ncbi:chitin deacetylase 1 isoform X20 [Penaeus vannamei]|uniref:chitin deacetylase 1 isoform X20 n=1 Tax=Penaeus vannamei TaxID=6689 RepID=UPI00387F65CE